MVGTAFRNGDHDIWGGGWGGGGVGGGLLSLTQEVIKGGAWSCLRAVETQKILQDTKEGDGGTLPLGILAVK
jgi:hypothetical protein